MDLNLNGRWRVTQIPFGDKLDQFLSENFVPEGWLEARVPEEIHATLRRAGLLRGNTYGKAEGEEAWVEECDWVYFREFYVPVEMKEPRVTLEFEGLDTFCEIYLNGIKLGEYDNMFLPFRADVGNSLCYGKRNTLLIRFFSAVRAVACKDDSAIFSITESDRIFARKAQMNYSWDFCGRCVTAGIWKPVRIYGESRAEISSYYLRTEEITLESARICLDVSCALPENENGGDLEVSMTLLDGEQTALAWSGSISQAEHLEFLLTDPKLWWPRPYGEPYLYEFELSLWKDKKLIQKRRQRFGVRTVRVLQETQPDGRSFQFAVNGKKLFLRGANWVPVNTVYTDIREDDYENLLDYAADANLSMLRIWGGGIYEPLRFFELCEERGLLVWSDFMFSCGIYPQDGEFLEKVRAEGEYVVKTYRNCTALAIWAGDNENGQAYGWAGRPYEFRQDRISRVELKEVCSRLDPCRFYLATSPDSPEESIQGGDNPASPYQGDTHLYIMSADPGVRGGRDYGKNYYKRILSYRPRFVSEFGFISFPEKDTFYRFNFRREPIVSRDELAEFLPFAAEYLRHGQVEKAIYFSQVYQSLALKYWIEYFRSLKGTCSGCLYWKFNDPLADRPTIGIFPSHMSMVDMYGNTKMAYYATRRAYEDLLIAFVETETGWNVFACNECEEEFSGVLTISRRAFSGGVLDMRRMSCTIPADSATVLCTLSREDCTVENRFEEYLKAEFTADGLCCENRWFFADICEIDRLSLTDAGLEIVRAERRGREFLVRLRAEYFARSVRLHILDHRARYSDNYFDLDAGAEKEVEITLKNEEEWNSAALYLEGENVDRQVLPLASFQRVD